MNNNEIKLDIACFIASVVFCARYISQEEGVTLNDAVKLLDNEDLLPDISEQAEKIKRIFEKHR